MVFITLLLGGNLARVLSFLGLALTSFLPVAIIQMVAVSDFDFAAELSRYFAIGTIVFSFLYMGQRQYINIHGPIVGSLVDLTFRLINMLIASWIVILVFYLMEIHLRFAFLIIGLKLSESIVDYMFGFLNYNYGFVRGSVKYFILTSLRLLVIILIFLICAFTANWKLDDIVDYTIPLLLVFGVVSYAYHFCFSTQGNLKHLNYIFILKKLLPFSLSASLCAFLVLAPRWLVSPDSDGDGANEFLVAFSLVPLFGIALNTLFVSYISLAKDSLKKAYVRLIIIIFLFSLLFISLMPFQIYLYGFLYGLDALGAGKFSEAILLGFVFYSAILFANFFKFYNPFFESLCYLLGIVILIFASTLQLNMSSAIILSSSAMMLFSLLSLNSKNEKNNFSKNI